MPHYLIEDDGVFPNNGKLAVIIYHSVFDAGESNAAIKFEELFNSNRWQHSWRNGIFPFHHYHSTAHEVLGIYEGKVQVQLGGENGVSVSLVKGDVVIIPAGIAHRNQSSSEDFKCVGAYPEGQDYDTNYGKADERPQADENINKLPLPPFDPVYGSSGLLTKLWKL